MQGLKQKKKSWAWTFFQVRGGEGLWQHAMTVATLTFERILWQSYCFPYSNWFFVSWIYGWPEEWNLYHTLGKLWAISLLINTRGVTIHLAHEMRLNTVQVSDVTYGQVWWPILGICALHLTHPKCTHTAVNTHTPWTHTHPEQWAALYAVAPGEQVLVLPWYWGWRERCTFTPPTYNSCRTWDSNSQPLDYESDSNH